MSRWRAHLAALVAREGAAGLPAPRPIGAIGANGSGVDDANDRQPGPEEEDWTAVDAWLRGAADDHLQPKEEHP